jgi:hypothetical protein
MSPLYIYAVAEIGDGAELGDGLAGEALEVLSAGPVSAVIGRVAQPPEAAASTLRAHDDVVRRLAARCRAVLPARFGSLAADDEALRAALADHAGEYTASLERVRGREQMTVRVFVAEGAAEAASAAEAADIAHPAAAGPGARYLAARAQEGGAAGIPGLPALLDRLAPLVAAQIVERHAAAPLVASVYHLVERDSSARYRDALREAAAAAPGLRVVASGPWPPYAFASGPA